MTLEQVKKLKQGDKVYFKTDKLTAEELTVDKVLLEDKIEVWFTDNTYCPLVDLDYIFISKLDCLKECKKELSKRVNELNLLLKQEK